ncbi:6583_t:CDS:2 [Dentiscutata heterogama]|uniref:6583_t:CDS:1 n=1 Tax=Dentiscutata heterogama TaxID=1316150 RepID=A0ACA9JY82_9GLOM|nr:6583_t:CDS:2 [Dentiscutata heterogama]
MPKMKVIISMDDLDDNDPAPDAITTGKVLKAWARDQGILLLDFIEVERLGQQYPHIHNPPSPDDIACICYTSGTTGVPKGALLTHTNFIGAKNGFNLCWAARQDDVCIFVLVLLYSIDFYLRPTIGYFRGNVLNLIDDMTELKPTIFPSVPRLLTRVHAKLQQNTVFAPGIKGALSRMAVSAKLKNLEDGKGFTHTLWDKLIFSKIKQVIGGRVRLILTGSAPIGPEVLQFLRIAFACDITEGYGQTEGICAATMTLKDENAAGHVGGPIPCNEIKLVDVPEMNYFSTDKPFPRGELCYRGPSVFRGYYKDDAKTKETIDKDGWLHSGDIAYINARGSAFCIIDRKKNIFKLSHGEYVAPEKIENAYVNSNLILQIFVHGDSLRNYLVAIVVPDPETFVPWANALIKQNVSLGDEKGLEILVNDKNVKKAFLEHMNEVAKQTKLKGFETVKAIYLSSVPFSVENHILTPTLKLKRHEAQKHFRSIIDKLYAESVNEIEPIDNPKSKL